MLDLDSAIKHSEEVMEEQENKAKVLNGDFYQSRRKDCLKCAAEHRQLAEWLRKYQKIEQILDDCDLEAWEILEKIKEVVKI